MTEAKTTSAETVTGGPTSLVVTRFDDLGKVIIKAAAIITAMISVAVPLTEYVRGYSNQKISEAERNSKLASEFLDKIAAKDVSSPDRLMYLSALANLKNHPLQDWAVEQRTMFEREIAGMKAIISKAQSAYESANAAKTKVRTLQAEIELADYTLQQARSVSQIEAQKNKLHTLHSEVANAKAHIAQQQEVVEATFTQALIEDRLRSDQRKQMEQLMENMLKNFNDPSMAIIRELR
jgi:YesN/AraC family two-component response regulator